MEESSMNDEFAFDYVDLEAKLGCAHTNVPVVDGDPG